MPRETEVHLVADGNVRIVDHFHGTDSRYRYVIARRDWVVQQIRRAGTWHIDPLELIPGLSSPFYCGPGGLFMSPPTRLWYSRRYVVAAQHSGLDV